MLTRLALLFVVLLLLLLVFRFWLGFILFAVPSFAAGFAAGFIVALIVFFRLNI